MFECLQALVLDLLCSETLSVILLFSLWTYFGTNLVCVLELGWEGLGKGRGIGSSFEIGLFSFWRGLVLYIICLIFIHLNIIYIYIIILKPSLTNDN